MSIRPEFLFVSTTPLENYLAQNPDKVFTTRSFTRCPVAQFLTSTLGESYSVGVHLYWSTKDAHLPGTPLPTWTSKFISAAGTTNYATGTELLEVLRKVKPLSPGVLPNKTVQDIRGVGACYDPVTGRDYDDNVIHPGGFVDENWQGNAWDVLTADNVPVKDRIWLALQSGWVPPAIHWKLSRWASRRVQEIVVQTGQYVGIPFSNNPNLTPLSIVYYFIHASETWRIRDTDDAWQLVLEHFQGLVYDWVYQEE